MTGFLDFPVCLNMIWEILTFCWSLNPNHVKYCTFKLYLDVFALNIYIYLIQIGIFLYIIATFVKKKDPQHTLAANWASLDPGSKNSVLDPYRLLHAFFSHLLQKKVQYIHFSTCSQIDTVLLNIFFWNQCTVCYHCCIN